MSKKFLAMFLGLIMIISTVSVCAERAETEITVYLSVSKYGEIVKDKNGNDMAQAVIDLSGKENYCLDDVFLEAHRVYYEDGTNGYASSDGELGRSVDKLWGDTSYRFGYQVNGGTESVSGLLHPVENGDYIDACIYQNSYPDTERYAKFDLPKTETYTDELFTLNLSCVSGYDERWNNVFSPCEGAVLTINGIETDIITDENGNATVTLQKPGKFLISARKNETSVPTITAPVCMAYVKLKPEIEIIHNIAAQYAQSNFADAAGNLPWILADMAVYEELFADSENCLTDEKKEEGLALVVSLANATEKPGDMAKAILAMRALGYDATNVFTENFEKLDVVAKLTALVDNNDTEVTNIYTLPYVMLALSQAEGYATQEQMEKLITAAIESKDMWQSIADGTDALTPMILALAPYYQTNEAVEILKSEQREDGLIDGYEGYEPASTGLAICALSAVGIDADEVKNDGNSLIDGLLSTANEELNAFPNAFATEQGFRGLLAWRLLLENKGKAMYDFSDYPMNEANILGVMHCPVVFSVSPDGVDVTIEGKEAISKNCFDLDAGRYTYTASAVGYETKTGVIDVTEEEAQTRTAKTVTVSLTKVSYGPGGGGASLPPDNDDKEEVQPETESGAEKLVFTDETFSDVKSGDWYYPAVQYVYENKLFNGTDTGFEPDVSMSRAMLVTVLYRLAAPAATNANSVFLDVPQNTWYTESIQWATENGIVTGVTDTSFAPDEAITREQLALILYRYAVLNGHDISAGKDAELFSYRDVEQVSAYAKDAMQYAVALGIIGGKTGDMLAPKDCATRAEVATMFMRFAEVATK